MPYATLSSSDFFLCLGVPATCLTPFLCFTGSESTNFDGGGVGESDLFLSATKSNRPCFSLRSSGRSGSGDPLSSSGSTDDFLLSFLFSGSAVCFLCASSKVGLSLCFL